VAVPLGMVVPAGAWENFRQATIRRLPKNAAGWYDAGWVATASHNTANTKHLTIRRPMIIYDLTCSCGAGFEGWFQDREDYETQRRRGLLCCPVCGGTDIHKVLSPVAVRRGGREGGPVVSEAAGEPGGAAIQARAAMELLRQVKRFVDSHFDDVGGDFARTALKMHYGVEEKRNIRGFATKAEEEMLEREGVETVKLPILSAAGDEGDESGN